MVPLISRNPQILAAQVLLHLHVGRVEEDGHCYSPALDARTRFRKLAKYLGTNVAFPEISDGVLFGTSIFAAVPWFRFAYYYVCVLILCCGFLATMHATLWILWQALLPVARWRLDLGHLGYAVALRAKDD